MTADAPHDDGRSRRSRTAGVVSTRASSHYSGRELIALGHEVKLMPAQYVKPYVKRGKNDMADAEAICEAVTRATMRSLRGREDARAAQYHDAASGSLDRPIAQTDNGGRVDLIDELPRLSGVKQKQNQPFF
jgi:transposase